MGPPRTLLALDAAGASCAVALWHQDRVVAERFAPMQRGQSERLVPLVQEVLAQAQLSPAALSAVVVTLGPGGFTGLRIALAAAEGFALALGIPLMGFDSFTAHRVAVPKGEQEGRRLLVVLDGKRAEVFAALEAQEPFAATPDALAALLPASPLLVTGDAVGQVLPCLQAQDVKVATSAGPLRVAALAAWAAQQPMPSAEAPSPSLLYLRAPDTTSPKVRT